MSTTDLLKSKVPSTKQSDEGDKKELTMFDKVCSEPFQKAMTIALPRTLTAERLTRVVMNAVRLEPKLKNTTPDSFYASVMMCASLGIEPNTPLGHCYLIPYKSECKLIIGYRGMIELARRSGQIQSLNAYAVYEKDEFKYELGLHPDVKHVPSSLVDRGELTHVYAVAVLVDGGVQFDVMSRGEVEKIRNKNSPSPDSKKPWTKNPWTTNFDEMAKKTVIRRLFKMLPVSIEMATAVDVDERTDRGEAYITPEAFVGVVDVTVTTTPQAPAVTVDAVEVPPEDVDDCPV